MEQRAKAAAGAVAGRSADGRTMIGLLPLSSSTTSLTWLPTMASTGRQAGSDPVSALRVGALSR